jgi:hypothetical protein
VDATDEVVAAGFWFVFVAELATVARVLSLEVEGAASLGDVDDAGARVVEVVPVRGCHEVVFPAEKLDLCASTPSLYFPFSFTSKLKQTGDVIVIFIIKDVLNLMI